MAITASVNVSSVQAKLDIWASSKNGMDKMDQKISDYIKHDIRETQTGSPVLTVGWVSDLANELCEMIKANAGGVADSVYASVGSISPNHPKPGVRGSITAELNFRDVWLSRPSLVRDRYGDIDNIIVLFEKGYHAKAKVFGKWHGEMTCSRPYREGLHFISNAVDTFNAAYSDLGITATVMDEYA